MTPLVTSSLPTALPRQSALLRRLAAIGLPLALLASTTLPARAGLPEVVFGAKPAVVAVGLYNALSSPRFTFRGTGFAVADGRLLITNFHVLPETTAELQQLTLQIGGNRAGGQDAAPETRQLTVLQTDKVHDLALLQLSGEPLPVLALDAAGAAREGQSVAFIGFPIGSVLGFSPVTHRAIISSITPFVLPPANARQLDAAAVARLRQGIFDILQLDGTAYPGNSGGPLFDAETGRVVGVINMVLVKASKESLLTNPSGITYAIPVRFVRELLRPR